MGNFEERGTSKGYPFILEVIGRQRHREVFSLYIFGERINAGRFPRCSCPAYGLKGCRNILWYS